MPVQSNKWGFTFAVDTRDFQKLTGSYKQIDDITQRVQNLRGELGGIVKGMVSDIAAQVAVIRNAVKDMTSAIKEAQSVLRQGSTSQSSSFGGGNTYIPKGTNTVPYLRKEYGLSRHEAANMIKEYDSKRVVRTIEGPQGQAQKTRRYVSQDKPNPLYNPAMVPRKDDAGNRFFSSTQVMTNIARVQTDRVVKSIDSLRKTIEKIPMGPAAAARNERSSPTPLPPPTRPPVDESGQAQTSRSSTSERGPPRSRFADKVSEAQIVYQAAAQAQKKEFDKFQSAPYRFGRSLLTTKDPSNSGQNTLQDKERSRLLASTLRGGNSSAEAFTLLKTIRQIIDVPGLMREIREATSKLAVGKGQQAPGKTVADLIYSHVLSPQLSSMSTQVGRDTKALGVDPAIGAKAFSSGISQLIGILSPSAGKSKDAADYEHRRDASAMKRFSAAMTESIVVPVGSSSKIRKNGNVDVRATENAGITSTDQGIVQIREFDKPSYRVGSHAGDHKILANVRSRVLDRDLADQDDDSSSNRIAKLKIRESILQQEMIKEGIQSGHIPDVGMPRGAGQTTVGTYFKHNGPRAYALARDPSIGIDQPEHEYLKNKQLGDSATKIYKQMSPLGEGTPEILHELGAIAHNTQVLAEKSGGMSGSSGNTAGERFSSWADRLHQNFGAGSFNSQTYPGRFANALGRVATYSGSAGLIYGGLNAVKSGVGSAIKFDSELGNLKKSINPTNSDTKKLGDAAMSMGTEFGTSTSEVMSAMTTYGQQGKSVNDILKDTRTALMATNVTTMTLAESTDALSTAEKQFGISAAGSEKILDSWVRLQNKTGVQAEVFAEGMKIAGVSAKAAGIDINLLNGIMAAMGQRTHESGERLATGMRYISEKIRTPKSLEVIEGVAGVNATNGQGQIKNGGVILTELAGKWSTLTDAQKQNVAQTIAGTEQMNHFLVMMEEWNKAVALSIDSQKASGDASKANAIEMGTLAKKLDQLKASYESLWQSLASSGALDVLKQVTDSLRGIIDLAGKANHATGGIIGGVAATVATAGIGVGGGSYLAGHFLPEVFSGNGEMDARKLKLEKEAAEKATKAAASESGGMLGVLGESASVAEVAAPALTARTSYLSRGRKRSIGLLAGGATLGAIYNSNFRQSKEGDAPTARDFVVGNALPTISSDLGMIGLLKKEGSLLKGQGVARTAGMVLVAGSMLSSLYNSFKEYRKQNADKTATAAKQNVDGSGNVDGKIQTPDAPEPNEMQTQFEAQSPNARMSKLFDGLTTSMDRIIDRNAELLKSTENVNRNANTSHFGDVSGTTAGLANLTRTGAALGQINSSSRDSLIGDISTPSTKATTERIKQAIGQVLASSAQSSTQSPAALFKTQLDVFKLTDANRGTNQDLLNKLIASGGSDNLSSAKLKENAGDIASELQGLATDIGALRKTGTAESNKQADVLTKRAQDTLAGQSRVLSDPLTNKVGSNLNLVGAQSADLTRSLVTTLGPLYNARRNSGEVSNIGQFLKQADVAAAFKLVDDNAKALAEQLTDVTKSFEEDSKRPDRDQANVDAAKRQVDGLSSVVASVKTTLAGAAKEIENFSYEARQAGFNIQRTQSQANLGTSSGLTGDNAGDYATKFLNSQIEQLKSQLGNASPSEQGRLNTKIDSYTGSIEQIKEQSAEAADRRNADLQGLPQSVLTRRLNNLGGVQEGLGSQGALQAARYQYTQLTESISKAISPALAKMGDIQKEGVIRQIQTLLAPISSRMNNLSRAADPGFNKEYALASTSEQSASDHITALSRQGMSMAQIFAEDPSLKEAAKSSSLISATLDKIATNDADKAALQFAQDTAANTKATADAIGQLNKYLSGVAGGKVEIQGPPKPGMSVGSMALAGSEAVDGKGRIRADGTPAVLHAGEIVLNKKQSAAFLQNHFASGTMPSGWGSVEPIPSPHSQLLQDRTNAFTQAVFANNSPSVLDYKQQADLDIFQDARSSLISNAKKYGLTSEQMTGILDRTQARVHSGTESLNGSAAYTMGTLTVDQSKNAASISNPLIAVTTTHGTTRKQKLASIEASLAHEVQHHLDASSSLTERLLKQLGGDKDLVANLGVAHQQELMMHLADKSKASLMTRGSVSTRYSKYIENGTIEQLLRGDNSKGFGNLTELNAGRVSLAASSKHALSPLSKALNAIKAQEEAALYAGAGRQGSYLSNSTTIDPQKLTELMAPLVQQRVALTSKFSGRLPTTKAELLDMMENGVKTPSKAKKIVNTKTAAPKLPSELTGAKPRYHYGSKGFDLSFENEKDLALFSTKGKAKEKYLGFLGEAGMTADEIKSGRASLSAYIKGMAKGSKETSLTIPANWAGGTVTAPTPAPVTPSVVEAVVKKARKRKAKASLGDGDFSIADIEALANGTLDADRSPQTAKLLKSKIAAGIAQRAKAAEVARRQARIANKVEGSSEFIGGITKGLNKGLKDHIGTGEGMFGSVGSLLKHDDLGHGVNSALFWIDLLGSKAAGVLGHQHGYDSTVGSGISILNNVSMLRSLNKGTYIKDFVMPQIDMARWIGSKAVPKFVSSGISRGLGKAGSGIKSVAGGAGELFEGTTGISLKATGELLGALSEGAGSVAGIAAAPSMALDVDRIGVYSSHKLGLISDNTAKRSGASLDAVGQGLLTNSGLAMIGSQFSDDWAADIQAAKDGQATLQTLMARNNFDADKSWYQSFASSNSSALTGDIAADIGRTNKRSEQMKSDALSATLLKTPLLLLARDVVQQQMALQTGGDGSISNLPGWVQKSIGSAKSGKPEDVLQAQSSMYDELITKLNGTMSSYSKVGQRLDGDAKYGATMKEMQDKLKSLQARRQEFQDALKNKDVDVADMYASAELFDKQSQIQSGATTGGRSTKKDTTKFGDFAAYALTLPKAVEQEAISYGAVRALGLLGYQNGDNAYRYYMDAAKMLPPTATVQDLFKDVITKHVNDAGGKTTSTSYSIDGYREKDAHKRFEEIKAGNIRDFIDQPGEHSELTARKTINRDETNQQNAQGAFLSGLSALPGVLAGGGKAISKAFGKLHLFEGGHQDWAGLDFAEAKASSAELYRQQGDRHLNMGKNKLNDDVVSQLSKKALTGGFASKGDFITAVSANKDLYGTLNRYNSLNAQIAKFKPNSLNAADEITLANLKAERSGLFASGQFSQKTLDSINSLGDSVQKQADHQAHMDGLSKSVLGFRSGTLSQSHSAAVDGFGRIRKDETPAMLHKGEVVLNRQQSDRFMDHIHKFESGTMAYDPMSMDASQFHSATGHVPTTKGSMHHHGEVIVTPSADMMGMIMQKIAEMMGKQSGGASFREGSLIPSRYSN